MKSILSVSFAVFLIFLNGCTDKTFKGKVDKTPYATKECKRTLSQGKEIVSSSQIDEIIVYKKKRKLYTYKNGKKINEFRISLGNKGGANAGDKVKRGDHRTPEGKYTIVRKKCDSRLYKSLMISYPNNQDISNAVKRGVHPGNYITIHGQPKWNADGNGDSYTLANDWTEGCLAVTNKSMDNLWSSVKNGTKIVIYP